MNVNHHCILSGTMCDDTTTLFHIAYCYNKGIVRFTIVPFPTHHIAVIHRNAQMVPRISSDATGTRDLGFLTLLRMFVAILGVILSILEMQQKTKP